MKLQSLAAGCRDLVPGINPGRAGSQGRSAYPHPPDDPGGSPPSDRRSASHFLHLVAVVHRLRPRGEDAQVGWSKQQGVLALIIDGCSRRSSYN